MGCFNLIFNAIVAFLIWGFFDWPLGTIWHWFFFGCLVALMAMVWTAIGYIAEEGADRLVDRVGQIEKRNYTGCLTVAGSFILVLFV